MIAVFFFFLALASGEEFRFEGRVHYSPIEANSLSEGIEYRNRLGRYFGYRAAARASQTAWSVNSLDYCGAVQLEPVSWARLQLRLNQQALVTEGTGSTDLFAGLKFEGHLGFIGAFVEAGWFERWIAISSTPLLPAFAQSSLRDHDFAAHFGIHVSPIDAIRLTLSAGTIEEILVFNFNNPFIEFRGTVTTRFGEVFAFGRYKMLLGFGRLDEFATGLGVQLDSPFG